MKTIRIPEVSLVVLVGVSGSGKSTFARKHFKPTEIVSSDFCRGLVSDDENDQSATESAFTLLNLIASERLKNRKLTVIDATNVQQGARKALIDLAKREHSLLHAIVLDVPEGECAARNERREDRNLPAHAVRNQRNQFRRSLSGLRREGFQGVTVLKGQEEIDSVVIEQARLLNDRSEEHGPFDIVGDVHGCFDELVSLMNNLGYEFNEDNTMAIHPEGRKMFFVGDLVDRGPASPAVLRLVMNMVREGTGICVPGNHEDKLKRHLKGRKVSISHGLAETIEQLDNETPEFREEVEKFIESLVSHLVVDDGKLVVAHAGMRADMQGRQSKAVRAFALYGDTTGETDEYGLPVRYPWARDYRGNAMVVYGHTPVPQAEWLNNTICLDTGCVFGGDLTALRYPEREIVAVPAAREYYEPIRPLHEPASQTLALEGNDLDLGDVIGKRLVSTELMHNVTIREENSIAALEAMSRFAVDPRWLVYLPPTMSPTATTNQPGMLEHPDEALNYFRNEGVKEVVCEEKHMGSRAVVVVCKDSDAAARRFGIADSVSAGVVVTRTGRAFFNDPVMEKGVLDLVLDGIAAADLWTELETDWMVIDAELLPWSLKAEELLRRQYASVGAAAQSTIKAETSVLERVAARGIDVGEADVRSNERSTMIDEFVTAYGRYCWPVSGIDDIKLAPFQILATEGKVTAKLDHGWHLEVLARLSATNDTFFRPTHNLRVDLSDEASCDRAAAWWTDMTAAGGEGMVVKPIDVIHRGPKGLSQPGIKVRGREYLRIIYGPEYTAEENLSRLRSRSLGLKRSLALREFALGIESLERFVAGEPLHKVHECVFGVLAMESEPVDPRL